MLMFKIHYQIKVSLRQEYLKVLNLAFLFSLAKELSILFYLVVKELSVLHDKHLNRPTLDDNVDEEHAIEIQTQEITQVISLLLKSILMLIN